MSTPLVPEVVPETDANSASLRVYTQERGGGYGHSPGPPLGFSPRPHYDSHFVCSPCMSTPHFLTWRHPWSHTLYTGSKLFLLHLLIFAMEVGKQRQGYQCCCSEEENGTFLHCFYSCNDDGDFADITRRVKIAAVCTVRILSKPRFSSRHPSKNSPERGLSLTEVISWPWPWPRMTLKVIQSWMSHRRLTSYQVSLRSDEVDFLANFEVT